MQPDVLKTKFLVIWVYVDKWIALLKWDRFSRLWAFLLIVVYSSLIVEVELLNQSI